MEPVCQLLTSYLTFARGRNQPKLVEELEEDCLPARELWVQLLHRNVKRFQGGLVFKAHRLCVSLNSRLESNKAEEEEPWDHILAHGVRGC